MACLSAGTAPAMCTSLTTTQSSMPILAARCVGRVRGSGRAAATPPTAPAPPCSRITHAYLRRQCKRCVAVLRAHSVCLSPLRLALAAYLPTHPPAPVRTQHAEAWS